MHLFYQNQNKVFFFKDISTVNFSTALQSIQYTKISMIQNQPINSSQLYLTNYDTLLDFDQSVIEPFENRSASQYIELQIQQGQMEKQDLDKLTIYNPKDNKFQEFNIKFNVCLDEIPTNNPNIKYQTMKKRFQKFFIKNQSFDRGYRWNRRIQADYTKEGTYPLCNSVMIYGADNLSNRDLKKLMKLDTGCQKIVRLNWSNVCIIFDSKNYLEQKLKGFMYVEEQQFFVPKVQQEEDQDQIEAESNLKDLPRIWYKLRPYEYNQEYCYWFVRYLTNNQREKLKEIQLSCEFDQIYDIAKTIWKRKAKNRQEIQNSELVSLTSRSKILSRNKTTDRSKLDAQSQQKQRQRSREKLSTTSNKYEKMQEEDQFLGPVNQNEYPLSQSEQKKPQKENSNDLSMSFMFPVQKKTQSDQKSEGDKILLMLEGLSLNKKSVTIENLIDSDLDDDDDMNVLTRAYDPNGVNDQILLQRSKIIAQKNEVKPFSKFKYNQYVQKTIEEEELNKQKKTRPIITILD